MYKVVVESVTFGRRIYAKDTVLTSKEMPERLLIQLEKDGKVKSESVKKEPKTDK